jgi:molybdopterin/thiamine biosynthesis adenylyltransferase
VLRHSSFTQTCFTSGLTFVPADALTSEELQRYARQIGPGVLTPEGQLRLRQSAVLVTRAGGMGGPAALCLTMAGVGRVVIAHGGEMRSPDLNRQVLGSEEVVGQPRAEHFAQRLRSMNRFVTVEAIDHEPDDQEAIALARQLDLIIASPPTFAERLRLNRAAVLAGIPLVDAAQWGMTGTLIVVRPGQTACLRCVYPDEPPFEEHFPVVGAISSAVGSLAALEAIKLLSGCGQTLAGKMQVIDAFHGATSQLALQRRPDCPECGGR